MKSHILVFLGPSLPVADARTILDAEYLPPAAIGDVYRALAKNPSIIAIVDGLFEQTPAVWHKEILFALSRGVRVLGASSMGALRASELEAFGMEGVGDVFEAFKSGALEDDDEVAIAHASADDRYHPLSDAMVSIRAGLRAAREAGTIDADIELKLTSAAKSQFYPDRSWQRLFQLAPTLDISVDVVAGLRSYIELHRPDVKRQDAICLLERLAAERNVAPRAPTFDFEPTAFWEAMTLHESIVSSEDDGDRDHLPVDLAAIRRHVRLHPARARDVLSTALLLHLADERVARGGIDYAAPSSVLPSPGAEHLSAAQREQLLRSESSVEALLRSAPDHVNRKLPAALARLGRLEPVLTHIQRKEALLHARGLRTAVPADAGSTVSDLLEWYVTQFGPMKTTPEAHAEEAGFASLEEFVGEVTLEYLVAHQGLSAAASSP